jgi:hypothetical protein
VPCDHARALACGALKTGYRAERTLWPETAVVTAWRVVTKARPPRSGGPPGTSGPPAQHPWPARSGRCGDPPPRWVDRLRPSRRPAAPDRRPAQWIAMTGAAHCGGPPRPSRLGAPALHRPGREVAVARAAHCVHPRRPSLWPGAPWCQKGREPRPVPATPKPATREHGRCLADQRSLREHDGLQGWRCGGRARPSRRPR